MTGSAKRAAILRALADGPKTAVEIAQETGLASNDVRRVLRQSAAFEACEVRHVKQGKAKVWRVSR